jgi:hypothetical protein
MALDFQPFADIMRSREKRRCAVAARPRSHRGRAPRCDGRGGGCLPRGGGGSSGLVETRDELRALKRAIDPLASSSISSSSSPAPPSSACFAAARTDSTSPRTHRD